MLDVSNIESLRVLSLDLLCAVDAVPPSSPSADRLAAVKRWFLRNSDSLNGLALDLDPLFVENKEAPGDLAVGDYVFASRWSDCSPGDPWAVGHVSEVGAYYVVIGEVNQRRWDKAMKISHEQGARIADLYPKLLESKNYGHLGVAWAWGVDVDAAIAAAKVL